VSLAHGSALPWERACAVRWGVRLPRGRVGIEQVLVAAQSAHDSGGGDPERVSSPRLSVASLVGCRSRRARIVVDGNRVGNDRGRRRGPIRLFGGGHGAPALHLWTLSAESGWREARWRLCSRVPGTLRVLRSCSS